MWKKSPPLYLQSPSKIWGPVKPPLFENLVGGSHSPPPPLQKVGGGCILCFSLAWSESQLKKNMYTPTLSHFMLLAACLSYGVFYYFIVGRGVLTPRPPPLFYEDLSFITYPHFSVSFAMKYKLIFYYK